MATPVNPITWCDSPMRVSRLLDWLDRNPDGRDVVFSKIQRATPLGFKPRKKLYWITEAAKAVFSVDEDEKMRKKCTDDLERLISSTRTQIHSWKSKYKAFNNVIGHEISNMPVEEIIPETLAFNIVENNLPNFPIWRRLHVHLRTMPHYNIFYMRQLFEDRETEIMESTTDNDTTSTSTSHPISGTKKRRPSKNFKSQDNRSVFSDDSDETYRPPSTVTDDSDDDFEVPAVSPNKLKAESVKGELKPELLQSNGQKVEVLLTPRKVVKRKHDDIEGSGAGAPVVLKSEPTIDSRSAHFQKERELELTIELKRLENEALERKATAEIRRLEFEAAAEERRQQAVHNDKRAVEKHELMMKMIMVAGMALGGQAIINPSS